MDREKVIRELETIRFNLRQMEHNLLADYCDDVLSLLKEQEQEIAFLKKMQLQTIGNMSEEDIGNSVAKADKRLVK